MVKFWYLGVCGEGVIISHKVIGVIYSLDLMPWG